MLILSLNTLSVKIGDKSFTMREMSGAEVEQFVKSTDQARKFLAKIELGQDTTPEDMESAEAANLEFWKTVLRDDSLTLEWLKKYTNDRFAREITEAQLKLNEFEASLGNLKLAMVASAAIQTARQLGPTLSALSPRSTT